VAPPPPEQLVFRGGAPRAAGAFVDAAQFAHNWRVFTLDQLAGLDWRGLVAAGGSVLACATTDAPAAPLGVRGRDVTRQLLCRAKLGGVDPALTASPTFLDLHGRDAPGNLAVADIDLWLVGLSAEEAAAKVAHVGAVLTANAAKRGATVMAARTAHTFTFFSAYPFRCVQVVNALFPTAAAPLLDFDLDSCCLCFDGQRVLALPRALAAAAGRVNVLRAGAEPRGLRSFTRAKKYAERGFALALPAACAAPVDAARADELFSAGKLAILMRKATVSPAQLANWRAPIASNLYPPQPASEPPQTWVTGVQSWERPPSIHTDARGWTYSAGIVQEDGSDDERADPDAKDILAQCDLVARLYPAPPRASSRRSLPQPDFPHELARPSDYGEGAPDIPYGPPLPGDSGRSPLAPLDLSKMVEDALDSLAWPPRRSPVDAVETGAMLQARAGRRVRVSNVGSLRAGPEAFKAAAFADAPSAADQHARVAFDTVALPELSFSAARATSQETEVQAFGATWRLSATTRGTWLVVRLEMLHRGADQRLLMLPLPLGAGAGESAGAAIDLDAPAQQQLLPLNIAVQAGPSMRTNGVLLDSHAVFGLGDGAPRSWSHVIYMDKLRDWPTAELPLRVTLQAVRLVG
jgi:hypothetical protein